MPLKSLLQELSERRVYRATAMYVVAVFALWQAADIAVPALGLPEVVMRYIVAGAILGLPVVVVLSWIYDLRIDGGRVNRTTRRILGFGFLVVLVFTVGLNLVRRERGQAAASAVGLPFEMGVEEFFSGNLRQAEAIFAGIAAAGSDSAGNQRDALRYLVRTYSLSAQRDDAREAMRRLLALEPPIALMLPGVETDSVMALYYDARRERLGAGTGPTQRSPIEAIEVFSFVDRTSLPDPDANAESQAGRVAPDRTGLGDGLAGLVVNELVQRTNGIKFIDRGFVGSQQGFEVYRYLESPSADRIIKPTHLIFGSIAGAAGSQMLLSAWVFEAASGRLTHSSQVLGPGHDLLALVARLTDDLIAKLLQDGA